MYPIIIILNLWLRNKPQITKSHAFQYLQFQRGEYEYLIWLQLIIMHVFIIFVAMTK